MNRQQLEELIKDQFGIPNLSPMMKSQIVKFTKSGLSYKDIGRSIFYYVNVLNKEPDKEELRKYGIGIVPNLLKEANEYFEAQKRLDNFYKKQGQKLKEIKRKEHKKKKFKAKPRQKTRKDKHINIDEL